MHLPLCIVISQFPIYISNRDRIHERQLIPCRGNNRRDHLLRQPFRPRLILRYFILFKPLFCRNFRFRRVDKVKKRCDYIFTTTTQPIRHYEQIPFSFDFFPPERATTLHLFLALHSPPPPPLHRVHTRYAFSSKYIARFEYDNNDKIFNNIYRGIDTIDKRA